jgi:mannose-6-phosphate isomerase-like protein (cupin superfamily)
MALGLTVILPWNSEAGQTVRAPTTYIIVRGEAALKIEGKTVLLERLDALHYSPGSQVEIRNAGDSSLFLLRVQDAT